ncbi:protein of unknown function (plasmid) [Cupriavidus taiwanensis]|nr:protein of unknown function [Cupriavidus taiwanensis]
MIRLVASLAGSLAEERWRPGAKTIWIGMQRTMDAALTIQTLRKSHDFRIRNALTFKSCLARAGRFERWTASVATAAAAALRIATFKQCRVNVDYHVEIDGHYYSVPHAWCERRSRLA